MKTSLSLTDISITVTSMSEWEKSLLPFIKGVGVFITTDGHFNLNQIVTFKVNLKGRAEAFGLTGRIVFVNPAFTQANFSQGIGVQITNPDWQMMKSKISLIVNEMEKEV